MPLDERARASRSVLRLTSASAIGPSLVVAADRGHAADDARRRARTSAPRGRQDVPGAVEVEEDEPARRPAEVVHPGHRLLPAVAALVQVHGGAQPVDLVDDRAVVGLEARAAAARPRSAAPRRPRARPAADRPLPQRDPRAARAPRASARSVPGWSVDRAVCRGVADEVGPRVAPGERLAPAPTRPRAARRARPSRR